MAPHRRHFTRILFNAPCQLQQGQATWTTQVVDISMQGVLIKCPQDWQDSGNEHYTVAIDLGDLKQAITMQVLLRHQANHNLGFLCQELDIDSATHLRRLIELNLGDESLLHRELKALIHSD